MKDTGLFHASVYDLDIHRFDFPNLMFLTELERELLLNTPKDHVPMAAHRGKAKPNLRLDAGKPRASLITKATQTEYPCNK